MFGELTKQYYTLQDISARLGEPVATLRHWEKTFGELGFQKTPRGTKRYTPGEVRHFERIYALLRVEGFTTEGAKRQIAEGENTTQKLSAARNELLKIRDFLEMLRESL